MTPEKIVKLNSWKSRQQLGSIFMNKSGRKIRRMSFQNKQDQLDTITNQVFSYALHKRVNYHIKSACNQSHTNTRQAEIKKFRSKVSCKQSPNQQLKQSADALRIKNSSDFKGMIKKCSKLNIDPLYLASNNYLRQGIGKVTQIHQFKGIGQIQLEDSRKYVRFHKIDFKTHWWLLTVAFALKAKMSFLYSTQPQDKFIQSKELVLVDHNFLIDLKLMIRKYNIKKSNYHNLLDYDHNLPIIMQTFKKMMKDNIIPKQLMQ